MTGLAIEAEGLEKVYRGWLGGGRPALAGVDLTVPRGSMFGLIGVNGAGKTTFIKAILAVLRPTRGEVRVLGGDPEDPQIRARIGYLPERLYFPRAWSGLAFMHSVARFKGLPSDVARVQIPAQLQRVGLLQDAARRVGGYSKGMRQRLGLASVLLGAPDLLVLDEPTDGVDPLGRSEIRRILLEERDRGATIFLNSHLLAETERVCDRVAILHRGKIVRDGSKAELLESKTRWWLRFASVPSPEALVAAGLSPVEGERWSLSADGPEALNAALDRVRASGALLTALTPEGRGLEEILAEAVGEAR